MNEHEHQPPTKHARRKFGAGTFALLCFVAVGLWSLNWWLLTTYGGDLAARGQFGDMFGSVNALFTALAFAGLTYTILLQREELAQQREAIEESNRSQERLAREQQRFQDEQRAKQEESRKAVESSRQTFLERTEQIRQEREAKDEKIFADNVLRAIRQELEALGTIYANGIGAKLRETPSAEPFRVRLAITQDWFTVYAANAVNLGRVDGEVCRQIVTVYALLKGLIEEFRINNKLLDEFDEVERTRATGFPPRNSIAKLTEWNIEQTGRIRAVDGILKIEVEKLYALLDKRGIK